MLWAAAQTLTVGASAENFIKKICIKYSNFRQVEQYWILVVRTFSTHFLSVCTTSWNKDGLSFVCCLVLLYKYSVVVDVVMWPTKWYEKRFTAYSSGTYIIRTVKSPRTPPIHSAIMHHTAAAAAAADSRGAQNKNSYATYVLALWYKELFSILLPRLATSSRWYLHMTTVVIWHRAWWQAKNPDTD